MEFLPKNELLEFHPDTLEVVRKMYNLDKPGEMDDAIDILDAWVKQQKHFKKKDFSRDYLERMIITAKGSVEKAKKKIDRLCTIKTLIPYMFGDYNIREDFKDADEQDIIAAPLPKLTSKHERILFARNRFNSNGTTEAILNAFRRITMMMEYLKSNDYTASIIIVCEITEMDITRFVSQVGFMDLKNIFDVITKGCGFRVSGIHLLTKSKVVDVLVMLMKQVVNEKIGKRICVHRTLESLYEYAPKEVFPVEFGEGGEDRSFDEIYERWADMLTREDYREFHRSMLEACTDESLRDKDIFNDEYLGMPGTFRNIQVD